MSGTETTPAVAPESNRSRPVRRFVDTSCAAYPETPRFRVNDPDIVLHPRFGRRSECSANGLLLVSCAIHPADIESAELRLAVWGGHPGTTAKRFSLNGKGMYRLPPDGAGAGHCAYTFPAMALEPRHLVEGTNALQFSCDSGSSFWGHFIVDEAVLRVFPNRGFASRGSLVSGVDAEIDFHSDTGSPADASASLPFIECGLDTESETLRIGLRSPVAFENQIARVDFFVSCLDYDESGSGGFGSAKGRAGAMSCVSRGFHGYPVPGGYRGHAGTAVAPPFACAACLSMVPDQTGPISLRAEVRLRDGSGIMVDGPADIPFPARRDCRVVLRAATEMPRPFWSRAGNRLQAAIATTDLPSAIGLMRGGILARAELLIKVWDGGRGAISHPVRINGFPVDVSGSGRHDFIFSRVPIDPEILVPATQTISLHSDTEHHGIEILLPGPALVLRFERRTSRSSPTNDPAVSVPGVEPTMASDISYGGST